MTLLAANPLARLRKMRILATVGAVLALGAIASEDSSARTIKPYAVSTNFNGADTEKGKFTMVDSIAYHQASDTIYVADSPAGNVRLMKFNSSGVAQKFSGLVNQDTILLGTPQTTNQGWGTYIAVDNSGGPTDGRIYVQPSTIGQPLYAFNPDGTPVGDPFPICGSPCSRWTGAAGMDVGPDGRVWIMTGGVLGSGNDSDSKIWWISPDGTISVNAKRAKQVGLFDKLAVRADGTALYTTRVNSTFGGAFSEMRLADEDGNLLETVLAPGGSQSQTTGVAAITSDRSNDYTYVTNRLSAVNVPTEVYDENFNLVDTFGAGSTTTAGNGIAIDWVSKSLYVSNRVNSNNKVDIYNQGAPVVVPDVTLGTPTSTASTVNMRGTVNLDSGGNTTDCYFKYGADPLTMNTTVTCSQGKVIATAGDVPVNAELKAVQKGTRYYYRLFAVNANGKVQGSRLGLAAVADAPSVQSLGVANVNTDSTDVKVALLPEGDFTQYWVEYGEGSNFDLTSAVATSTVSTGTPAVTVKLKGLTPGATYEYRFHARNQQGEYISDVKEFTTFEFVPELVDSCSNALSRQQTGAGMLLDCRAYEFVSSPNTGGVPVSSDLVEGQEFYGSNPNSIDSSFYSVDGATVPGPGNPPNRDLDPYLAERGGSGWTTSYVGIPANPIAGETVKPFSSRLVAASDDRQTLVFGGDDLCDPCFEDGSVGIPVRRDGELLQGMQGSLAVPKPVSSGEVRQPLSADGSTLVFGSEQKFEPTGHNGALTIYARDLEATSTEVVSTAANGSTLSGTVVGLGVSSDGSRVLIGREVGQDAAGNNLYDLYLHVRGQSQSIVVADTASGVIPAGMSDDGTVVHFTTSDKLSGETDIGADLFRATLSGAPSVERISPSQSDACTPTDNWNSVDGSDNCSVLAIGGGGGASDDGTVAYFLSPEQLDGGEGVGGEPNLYVTEGGSPVFVATLDPTDPVVVGAREDAAVRPTSQFQVGSGGEFSAFVTKSQIGSNESRGFAQVGWYSVDKQDRTCVSCPITNAPLIADARLASNGSSLADDGRVFFVSGDPLVLRDTNNRDDVYQWSPIDDGIAELISTGIENNPSSLLGVSADGDDVQFFSRARLTPTVPPGAQARIYSARAGGGFFYVPPSPPCAAADECRGPGTDPGEEKSVRTVAGEPGQVMDCGDLATKAQSSNTRAAALRKKAKAARSKAKAKSLRKKANAAAKNAKKQRAATERCRRSGGVG